MTDPGIKERSNGHFRPYYRPYYFDMKMSRPYYCDMGNLRPYYSGMAIGSAGALLGGEARRSMPRWVMRPMSGVA